MASTVLPNGIIIPEKYSRDWYNDLYHNWQELDNLLGGGTPKDGTLTIQKNGSTVGTFSANQSTNETIDITVPDVNDATLTIQKNGTTVDSFSANSSTDKTVNITVPTKTSDLTNDSGFITEDNTKIPLAGSNQISGSLIPSTDGTVNLGSPSYQWNNAYIKSLTINGVACGDILTHNASEFVDVSSDQTIGGEKTFSDIISSDGSYLGNESSTNERTNLCLRAKRDIAGQSGAYIGRFRQNRAQGAMSGGDVSFVSFDFLENSTRYTRCFTMGLTDWDSDGVPQTYYLTAPSGKGSLGTAFQKWWSINGINPGALSLPSSTYINVDTTNWDVAGGTNVYTPPANGWLHIRVVGATELMVRWTGWRFGDRRVSATATDLGVTIPVVAGVTVDVVTVASDFDGKCLFFPCQGNV